MSEQNPSSELPSALPPPQPPPPQPPQPPQPPPQQSFGAAPAAPGGTPGGTESFGSAPAPAESVGPAPAKKRGLGKIIGGAVTVILILCIGGAFFLIRNVLNDDATKEATTGSCIADLPEVAEGQDKEANDARVVDCTDAAAAYKVEGRLDGKTEAEATSDTICQAYPAAEFVYRAIETGGTGYVLCLSQIQK